MSVHSGGVRPWIVQRVTALYIGIFAFIAIAALLLFPVEDVVEWRTRMAHPVVNVATLLFVIAMLIHAWIGVRDIVMDYVHRISWRFLLLSLMVVYFSAMAVWVVRILAGLW